MPSARWPARYDRVRLDHHWMERGACLDRTDLPWTGDRPLPGERAQMAGVCASCPVFVECRLFAIRARVTAGYWAGASRGGSHPGTTDADPVLPLRDVGGAA
jgi:hypothetical protein